jgi:hypothetical protein
MVFHNALLSAWNPGYVRVPDRHAGGPAPLFRWDAPSSGPAVAGPVVMNGKLSTYNEKRVSRGGGSGGGWPQPELSTAFADPSSARTRGRGRSTPQRLAWESDGLVGIPAMASS